MPNTFAPTPTPAEQAAKAKRDAAAAGLVTVRGNKGKPRTLATLRAECDALLDLLEELRDRVERLESK